MVRARLDLGQRLQHGQRLPAPRLAERVQRAPARAEVLQRAVHLCPAPASKHDNAQSLQLRIMRAVLAPFV